MHSLAVLMAKSYLSRFQPWETCIRESVSTTPQQDQPAEGVPVYIETLDRPLVLKFTASIAKGGATGRSVDDVGKPVTSFDYENHTHQCVHSKRVFHVARGERRWLAVRQIELNLIEAFLCVKIIAFSHPIILLSVGHRDSCQAESFRRTTAFAGAVDESGSDKSTDAKVSAKARATRQGTCRARHLKSCDVRGHE